ncbi:hypothetical protein Y036_5932 [Burkholderia pseudomallei]|uniref:Uncharacterized protein n=1 Tax=Burkholderia pseudomallei TaxID=28450 RepID=A0AA40JIT0_BURPE|nr:hypothetical protein Y036_5932 [Burkholderia pseudomallei]
MRRPTRKPLTRQQLLPLPADQVRRLQLKHHSALAALIAGRADVAQLGALVSTLDLTHALSDFTKPDPTRHHAARGALERIVVQLAGGAPTVPSDDERLALEYVLLIHDAQLAAVPRHRYLDALMSVQRAVSATAP